MIWTSTLFVNWIFSSLLLDDPDPAALPSILPTTGILLTWLCASSLTILPASFPVFALPLINNPSPPSYPISFAATGKFLPLTFIVLNLTNNLLSLSTQLPVITCPFFICYEPTLKLSRRTNDKLLPLVAYPDEINLPLTDFPTLTTLGAVCAGGFTNWVSKFILSSSTVAGW